MPRRGAAHDPAAATPYDRLPRTLAWAWWRPLVAIAVGGVLALLGSTLVLVLGMLLAAAAGDLQLTTQGMTDWVDGLLEIDATDPITLLLTLGSIAIWLPAIAVALRIAGMRPLGHLHSVDLRLRWGWLGRCTVVALVTLVVSFSLSLGLGAFAGEAIEPRWTPWQDLILPVVIVLAIVPLQAAAEEYAFRGVLVQALGSWLPRGAWSRVVVVAVPTVAFVLSHAYGLWGQLDVGVFALAAMWVTLRTGGLEAAIALHVVNNVVVFLMLASGALGSTVNGADGGSLAGVLITAITSIGFCWVVETMARRRGIARYSTWPERRPVPALPVPPPPSLIGWSGPATATPSAPPAAVVPSTHG